LQNKQNNSTAKPPAYSVLPSTAKKLLNHLPAATSTISCNQEPSFFGEFAELNRCTAATFICQAVRAHYACSLRAEYGCFINFGYNILVVFKILVILPKPDAMLYLPLCILSSAVILVVFKIAERMKINTLSIILINYIVACLAGFFLFRGEGAFSGQFSPGSIAFMVCLGVLLVVVFRLVGLSTQRAGIAATSVASKMSVVLPILFSIWIDPHDKLTSTKLAGIVVALVAVILSVYRNDNPRDSLRKIYLPVLIFFGIGTIDSSVKYAQATFVTGELNPLFNFVIFGVAFIAGFAMVAFSKPALKDLQHLKTWLVGVVLGLANFGSMYFMIAALNHINPATGKPAQGSVVFGINNIGVVVLGVLLGYTFFKERPTRLNWSGIALSVVAIFILMNS